MITEDYVSIETAKLLIEKGFDEVCFKYALNGEIYNNGDFVISHRDDVEIGIPTLQMAMKWLRKEHNIHIQAFRYPAKVKRDAESSEYSKPWFYQYTFLTELEDIDTDFCGDENFETSEEAIDAGIKYCIENLI